MEGIRARVDILVFVGTRGCLKKAIYIYIYILHRMHPQTSSRRNHPSASEDLGTPARIPAQLNQAGPVLLGSATGKIVTI